MAYQLNPNSGSLFVNQKKNQPNQPDYNGTVNIEGKVFYVAGWKKAGKDGTTWLSLAFSEPKQKQEITSKPPQSKTGPFADMDDNLPF
jgi:uncharacterized protein (DUF736 family)